MEGHRLFPANFLTRVCEVSQLVFAAFTIDYRPSLCLFPGFNWVMFHRIVFSFQA